MTLKKITGVIVLLLLAQLVHAQRGDHMTTFSPSTNGFKFNNTFKIQVIGNITMSGFCAGMTYSVLDYFKANMPIPGQNYRPTNNTPLYNYIWDRQKTANTSNADKWAELTLNPFGSRTNEFFDWGLKGTDGGRLQELMAEIDKGNPVPLGLFKPDADITSHHCVLAIGYNLGKYKGDLGDFKTDLKIMVCDPNYPGMIKTLRPLPSEHYYYYEDDATNTKCQWMTYFVDKKYTAKNPPVITDDIIPADGLVHKIVLELTTGNDDLRGGNDNLNASVTFNTSQQEQIFFNINKGASWINNYMETVVLTLSKPVPESALKELHLWITSKGGTDGDNWDLNKIRAVIGNKDVVNETGSPLFRFTGDSGGRTWKFMTSPVPSNMISKFTFEFRTGADDLRGGSDNLAIFVKKINVIEWGEANVNKSVSWGNYVTTTCTITPDKPFALSELKTITLQTSYAPGVPNADNWNLDYLMIKAYIGGKDVLIYFKMGTPLKRFTGSDNKLMINFGTVSS
jgi:hypothetical protein